jgi:hypothetical protein
MGEFEGMIVSLRMEDDPAHSQFDTFLRVNRSEHYWKLQIWEVKDLTVVNNRLV